MKNVRVHPVPYLLFSAFVHKFFVYLDTKGAFFVYLDTKKAISTNSTQIFSRPTKAHYVKNHAMLLLKVQQFYVENSYPNCRL
jgi:hypothetical protein